MGVHHKTIASWRKAEGWDEWAEAKDLEGAQDMELEAAVAEAELRMLAAEMRSGAFQAVLAVNANQETNQTDAMDMGAAGSYAAKAFQANDVLYGLSAKHTRKVEHSGSVEVKHVDEAKVSDKLAQWKAQREQEARA